MTTARPQRDDHKVCFITFGCQMNKLDSELAAAEFLRHGLTLTPPDEAGVIVINTCSVRRHAEQRALSNLGRFKPAKRQHPSLVLCLMGCMAQKAGEDLLRSCPHLDVVCGTRQFLHLPELVERARAEAGRFVLTGEAAVAVDRLPAARPDRWRAFVSIMRGCNSFCSYCIVPYVRGREVSRPPAGVDHEVRRLVGDGCVEITLLGQNIDAYRHRDADLTALLERLNRIGGLQRLRFVTSHPRDISERLLQQAMADLPAVCEYLHMPAQSGSSRILQAMNRGYTAERYRGLVDTARGLVPGIEIASDFIVGFPGETDDDFEQTADLIRHCRFNQSFIFKYSPREGTRAAKLPDNVPLNVKRHRNHALLAVQEEVSSEHNAAKVGCTLEVMVEGPSKRDSARLTSRTRGNDIVVFPVPDAAVVPGTLLPVRIIDATPLTLFGDVARGQRRQDPQ